MHLWYRFIDALVWPITHIVLRLFYRVEIAGREHVRGLQFPVIITSNHITLFDGFLVGLPFPFWSRAFPLRFMVETQEFKGNVLPFLARTRILHFIYFLTGGFPSHRGSGIPVAIRKPLRLLAKGRTVVMFPEGGLGNGEELGPFFHGTSAMALESQVPILPMSLSRRNGTLRIAVGESFRLRSVSKEEGTALIRSQILALKG